MWEFALVSMGMQFATALFTTPQDAARENEKRKQACEAYAQAMQQIQEVDGLISSLVPGMRMNPESHEFISHLASRAQILHKQTGDAKGHFIQSTAIQVILCIAVTAGLVIFLVMKHRKSIAELGDLQTEVSNLMTAANARSAVGRAA